MKMSQSRAPLFTISSVELFELEAQMFLALYRSRPTIDSLAQLFVGALNVRQDCERHLELGFKILRGNRRVSPRRLMRGLQHDHARSSKLIVAHFQTHWRYSDQSEVSRKFHRMTAALAPALPR
jgi:hypothetical protein